MGYGFHIQVQSSVSYGGRSARFGDEVVVEHEGCALLGRVVGFVNGRVQIDYPDYGTIDGEHGRHFDETLAPGYLQERGWKFLDTFVGKE